MDTQPEKRPKSIRATATVRISGTRNAWSVAQPGQNSRGEDCVVELEIQGDGRNGYHLVMSPAGHFTADTWYKSRQEAKDDALEHFGVQYDEWSPVDES